MNKLIAVLVVSFWLVGCAEEKPQPPQAKAWCQYNAFENQSYREYADQHQSAGRPGEQEMMLNELRPKLKAERDKLFGAMTDDQFGLLQMQASKDNWYQSYCQ